MSHLILNIKQFIFSWLTPYTSCDQTQTEDMNGAHTSQTYDYVETLLKNFNHSK